MMRRTAVLCILIWLGVISAAGQEVIPAAGQEVTPAEYIHKGELDFFVGLDFNYKDITYDRQYDVLLHLTPGMKWYFGRHWTFSAQALIPVVNTYGDYYSHIRPGAVSLSREFNIRDSFFIRLTGGLFTRDRYGLDLKMVLPLAEWIALEGQIGCTGWWGMYDEVKFSYPRKVTGTIGGSIWLDRWNTQMKGAAGYYINDDWGGTAELLRHFRHTTVGLYGQWSNLGGWNAGFKVVVMLPPFRKRHHAVNCRLASNFRLTYNYGADPYFNKMYATDPEENEREGWFSRGVTRWGPYSIDPDFTVKEAARK